MTENALKFRAPQLLIERFRVDHLVSKTEALERFEETKKFLVLSAGNPTVSYSPSKLVDEMWHSFILHTRDYLAFCQELGYFMHHIPSRKPMLKNYSRTKRDLQKRFGTLNEKFWSNDSADCGGGSCDCCPFAETKEV
jgi:hypothetical protein